MHLCDSTEVSMVARVYMRAEFVPFSSSETLSTTLLISCSKVRILALSVRASAVSGTTGIQFPELEYTESGHLLDSVHAVNILIFRHLVGGFLQSFIYFSF